MDVSSRAGALISYRISFVVEKNALGRTVDVLVLSTFERPHERAKAHGAQAQGNRYQVKEIHGQLLPAASFGGEAHSLRTVGTAFRGPRSRSALAMTISDDTDIATAAMSGVTYPRTATGTAITL